MAPRSLLRSLSLPLLLHARHVRSFLTLHSARRGASHAPSHLNMTSSSSSAGKDYYAGIQSKWVDEYPSPANIDDVWSFYKECGYDDPSATLRSMLESIDFKKKRILDYGCDNGLMLDFFVSSLDGVEGHGVDINEKAVNSAREKFPSMTFAASDGISIPYPDKHFDCVIAIATIKHVRYEDRKAVYAELNRVAEYAFLIEADEKEQQEQSFMGWTFYNTNFAEEFDGNFAEPVKVVRMAGDVLGCTSAKIKQAEGGRTCCPYLIHWARKITSGEVFASLQTARRT